MKSSTSHWANPVNAQIARQNAANQQMYQPRSVPVVPPLPYASTPSFSSTPSSSSENRASVGLGFRVLGELFLTGCGVCFQCNCCRNVSFPPTLKKLLLTFAATIIAIPGAILITIGLSNNDVGSTVGGAICLAIAAILLAAALKIACCPAPDNIQNRNTPV